MKSIRRPQKSEINDHIFKGTVYLWTSKLTLPFLISVSTEPQHQLEPYHSKFYLNIAYFWWTTTAGSFSRTTIPLITLPHKDQLYMWNVHQEEPIQTLKPKLCKTSVFTMLVGSIDLTIYYNASSYKLRFDPIQPSKADVTVDTLSRRSQIKLYSNLTHLWFSNPYSSNTPPNHKIG
jgi:hypothetical protein